MDNYGCPGHFHRGICSNSLCESRELIEERLLDGIRQQLVDSTAIDYAAASLKKSLASEGKLEHAAVLSRKEAQLRLELARLAEAVATSGGSKTLIETLKNKESELEGVSNAIASLKRIQVPVEVQWLRKRIEQEISSLPALLNWDPDRAKAFLVGHVSEIKMSVIGDDERKHYVAEGEWLTGEKSEVTGAMLNGDFRMVAGDRNVPNAHCIFIKIHAAFLPAFPGARRTNRIGD